MKKPVIVVLCCLLALGTATFVFTWCPPDGLLFRDLSLPAIYSLPC